MRLLSLMCAVGVLGGFVAVRGPFASAQDPTGSTFRLYLIDVEGGGATLMVSSSGESMLVDTGNGQASADRDVGRIVAAMEDAGVSGIDYLVTTHWHGDHFGGLAELADRVPIRHYIDHGANVQPGAGTDAFLEGRYRELYQRADRTVVRPGDTIPIDGVAVTVVASAGEVIRAEGVRNPYCAGFEPQPEDTTENAQSVGMLVAFGDFRLLHLGDLTANKEFELMCPTNPIGEVDLFVVSHHGQPSSNTAALVHAIAPRVAVMNNGTGKGGQPETMRVLYSSPGLENLWQLHFSLLSGQEYTVPGLFIANAFDDQDPSLPVAPAPAGRGRGAAPAPAHNGPAYWIQVTAEADGSFTVTNSRNGFSKRY